MKKIMLTLLSSLCFSATYADPVLPVYSRPVKISTAQVPQLKEASGISISQKNPGIAWIHNDSGNGPVVWGIRLKDGVCIAQINMVGASNQDVEDIALGTYAGIDTLFVGDIGDNKLRRGTYYINVMPEPDLTGMSNCKKIPTTVKKIKFKYPKNGIYNSEAVVFSEEFQKLYIIIKALKTEMFEFQTLNTDGSVNYLQSMGKINVPTVTGADMSRNGEGLILRSYKSAHESRKYPGDDPLRFLQSKFVAVPAPTEPQGEAIAYDTQGNYYTISEKVPAIYKITRIK